VVVKIKVQKISKHSLTKWGRPQYKKFPPQAAWRAKKNRVNKLKKEYGQLTHDRKEIERMAKDFQTQDLNVVPEGVLNLVERKHTRWNKCKLNWCKEFTEGEIVDAWFEISPLKAAGPWLLDQFFIEIGRSWRQMWSSMAIRIFFETGLMLEGVNDTSIVLTSW
jgi:hypothetical protein